MTNIAVPSEGSDAAINMYKGQHSIFSLIIGESGRGKTTSLRNLPPDQTHLINVTGKSLPFQSGLAYTTGKNMTVTARGPEIREVMKKVSKDESVEYLAVDDLHYIMATEFMDKATVGGYEKWNIMARNIWDLLVTASHLRPGLKVFLLTHEEETATGRKKMKTLGKLLDDKITPEGLAPIVLWSESEFVGENDPPKYFFSTQTDGMTTAKSPMGMFPLRMDNDLLKVAARIDEYYVGVDLKDSKVIHWSESILAK
jgi:hypothetical protein